MLLNLQSIMQRYKPLDVLHVGRAVVTEETDVNGDPIDVFRVRVPFLLELADSQLPVFNIGDGGSGIGAEGSQVAVTFPDKNIYNPGYAPVYVVQVP
jgi:hypothetical protein